MHHALGSICTGGDKPSEWIASRGLQQRGLAKECASLERIEIVVLAFVLILTGDRETNC